MTVSKKPQQTKPCVTVQEQSPRFKISRKFLWLFMVPALLLVIGATANSVLSHIWPAPVVPPTSPKHQEMGATTIATSIKNDDVKTFSTKISPTVNSNNKEKSRKHGVIADNNDTKQDIPRMEMANKLSDLIDKLVTEYPSVKRGALVNLADKKAVKHHEEGLALMERIAELAEKLGDEVAWERHLLPRGYGAFGASDIKIVTPHRRSASPSIRD